MDRFKLAIWITNPDLVYLIPPVYPVSGLASDFSELVQIDWVDIQRPANFLTML